MNSAHYNKDRQERHEIIVTKIGYGKPIQKAIVNKGHINGPEIHLVTDTGIIVIYNYYTKIHVTDLIARPEQLTRYNTNNWICPKETLEKAKYHVAMGWNKI